MNNYILLNLQSEEFKDSLKEKVNELQMNE